VGKVGGPTTRDLFLQSPTIQELGTSEVYLAPLRRFQKRIALANAYRTDVLVSTRSGAFLSSNGVYTTNSTAAQGKKNYALVMECTPRNSEGDYNKEDMADCLDSVGWTKILLDIRDDLPFPAISNPFRKKQPEPPVPEREVWTAQELMETFDRSPGSSWKIPLGHQVSSVNSKNSLYSRISSGGQPTMDQLGKDLLEIVHEQQCSTSNSDTGISIPPPEPALFAPSPIPPDEPLTKESATISGGGSMPVSKDSSRKVSVSEEES
jgi:hypothetical protein